jgi:hypothetical protein
MVEGRRLAGADVERRTREAPPVEGTHERRLVHQATPTDVHEDGAPRHRFEEVGVDHPLRVGGQRQVQREHIG